jgi:hypothetical protein
LEDVFISVFKEKTDRELRAYIYNLWNLDLWITEISKPLPQPITAEVKSASYFIIIGLKTI